ncbi:MAG: flagellar hook-length control protein FliK [Steroidobacteraceae bacterium]
MRIDVPSSTSLGLLARAPGFIPEWRVGSVVEATAVRDSASGQLWLNIGQARVPARVASGDPLGPAEGEVLKLRVLRNSPVIAFETLETEATSNPELAGESLRRALPRQASPAALLANAGWLASQGDAARALPPRLLMALAALWEGLPTPAQLASAQGLEAAIRRSGLFLESQLGQNLSPASLARIPAHDLKALLLSIRSMAAEQPGTRSGTNALPLTGTAPLPMLRGSLVPLADSAPSLASLSVPADQVDELLRQTEGALARLTATQLINASAQGMAYLIEVPVRHDNDARMLRFRFEQQQDPLPGQPRGWSVEAVLTLRHGEAVHARVVFQSGRIAVHLRSDSAAVVDRLKLSRDALTGALLAAGLDVEQVVCLHGLPAADPGHSRAQLVDTHA